jgi:glucose uptake protein GlcU
MVSFLGLGYAGLAAICFGLQYVPVKDNEIHDGTLFQWYMCNGILMLGFLVAIITGELHMGDDLLIVLGGVYWGLSNYLVLPCVKLLGLGLGFSLYHFVNLMVAYCIGRFGLAGMPKMTGNMAVCDAGCLLILVSFIIMVSIEEDTHGKKDASREPENVAKARDQYRDWREQKYDTAAKDKNGGRQRSRTVGFQVSNVLTDISFGEKGTHRLSVGGFSVHGAPHVEMQIPEEAILACTDSSPSEVGKATEETPLLPGVKDGSDARGQILASAEAGFSTAKGRASTLPPMRARLITMKSLSSEDSPRSRALLRLGGIFLAICAGGLCGIQGVPGALHVQKYPEQPAIAVVFPQCVGIWVASSAIYLAYATFADWQGWEVHNSVIRPAYFSGCIWTTGFVLLTLGVKQLGFSICYTIDAVLPIAIAGLLSVFVFKEIQGTRSLMLFACAFVLQATGVTLIAFFGSGGS